MGLISWFKGLFNSRDKPQNNYRFSAFPFFWGKSTSGKNVSEISAMQLSVVYACVKVLAESIAALPLHVYEQNGGNKERALKHPLYTLLHDTPNADMTSFFFRETLMTHLLLYGNAYAQILRDGNGRIAAIYPLMPKRMSVERDDNGAKVYVYTISKGENPYITDGGQITFRAENILHICGLGFDGLIGYSPIAMARNAIGLAIACEDFGSKFFANGARPSGILKTPTLIKDPAKLRESWESMYGGENAGRVAVLEQGVEYQQISVPNNDAQFLESRRFQTEEIARIFRVPLHLLNDLSHATFSNIEHQSLDFVVHTLTPWLVRWEQAMNKSLFSTAERDKFFIKFNTGGLLRGDIQSRYSAYATARQNGWMSSNDIRELEDLNLIPDEEGGNLYLINGSMSKLSQAGAAYGNGLNGGDKNE